MHDIPADQLTSEQYRIQSRPDLPVQTVDGFASFAVMAIEAPYRPLANMDLVQLETPRAAKVSAAEDHV
jgi:hypothetical protein